ncbi:MAG: dipeptidyl peptidase [Chitinophagaceae bacterium]|nr:dipeptidyl peptidase [Chitinophagaceae bacterium]
MKYKWFCLLLVLVPVLNYAQTLTVEKIMQDPKWIGTSPANIYWTYDSKTVYFDWNPEKKTSDSVYRFDLNNKLPVKGSYKEAALLSAINNGKYNRNYTQLVYTYRGDVYLLDLKANKTLRVTQTEDAEVNPSFIRNDEWIVYNRNQNLFAWNNKTGVTEQVTNFARSGETAAPVPAANAFRGGGGNFNRGNNTGGEVSRGNQQDQWLQQEQLRTSDILKERKAKREERTAFLKTVRDTDTLKIINTGDKQLQALQSSPDGRFITYRLYTAPIGVKTTIVPDYVTESGFTTDIPNRTKVGVQQGRSEFYVYDTEKDTVMLVAIDSLPGMNDLPDYVKDYPQKNRRQMARAVDVSNIYWNEDGTAAVINIRSQDNKDRWLMQLDPSTGKLNLVDRQRDEAWVGGPGIFGSTGWLNDHTIYFQSEATGYSHVYTYDVAAHVKLPITQGKFEIQQLRLSRDKKCFYVLTNELHPGKQNWYRMKTDGTQKQQITNMEGQYEVSMSPDEKFIAYRYSYINKPWELYIQENAPAKKPVRVTDKAITQEFASYPWRDTKIFTIKARDGQDVYTRVYEPAAGKKNGAAVIFVHGAGYLQNVHFGWSSYFREYMFNNLLADKGYTVLDIDYRGSSGYGRDWRTGIYRYMGGKDLNDEVDAAKYLVTQMGIDPNRIGLYGGSYGGFMTLMALFTQPDVFKAGAALRPVTDWAHYNHGYTANILNEPFNDSLAYERSSPINFAAGLKNHLLICHGMVDQNVNFQDAVRLTQRLIELGKNNWELAVYPVEDHGFVEPSSWTDEYKRILKLFDENLLPK